MTTRDPEFFNEEVSTKQKIGIIIGVLLIFLGGLVIILNPSSLMFRIFGIILFIIGFSLFFITAGEGSPGPIATIT
jgi:hypothetical protein